MKFSGVGIFRHTYYNPKKISKFEERVVVAKADSLKEAENLILTEFNEYAVDNIHFLGVYEIAEIVENNDTQVTEVLSSMKIFQGTDEEYLDRYWVDQQPCSCEKVGWQHVWFKHKEGIFRCYNCQEERTEIIHE